MNQKLIDKIQKLLSLATSSNEHEAKLAADKANELLIRHNLSAEDLEVSKEDKYVNEVVFTAKRYPFEATWAGHIIKEHFFCNVLHQKSHVTYKGHSGCKVWFIGEKTNVQVARYVFEFLVRKYKELWKSYQESEQVPHSHKGAYYQGLTLGLDDQLSATRKRIETEMALVLRKDPFIDEVMNMHHGKIRSSSVAPMVDDLDTMNAGFTEGQKLKIARGIEAKGDNQTLALAHKK